MTAARDDEYLTPCQWHLNSINLADTNHAIFHIPFPYNSEFEYIVDRALIRSDCIVILVSELHPSTVDFITRYQRSNIKYFTCGSIEGIESNRWMNWFILGTDFYKRNNILDQLTPYTTKEKIFDILLGSSRPHRDFINNAVRLYGLSDVSILTYYKYTHRELFINDDFIVEPGTIAIAPITHTIGKVDYYGEEVHISTIVPISIYNQTAYSIVAETNFDNHYSFYTEKIVKPILAKRLFIVFSGQHYLRNLRSLGFKTFDSIIDETYDTIEDSTIRFEQTIKQMQYLVTIPQEEILAKIKPIVEHNYQLMLSTDWLGQFHAKLKTVLTETK